MTARRILLFLSLAATLAAVYFAPAREDAVVEASVRPAVSNASSGATRAEGEARAAKPAQVIALRSRDEADDSEPRLFSTQSWDPQPSQVQETRQAAVETPPPAPQAPPVPLQLTGRYEEGGKVAMFGIFNGDSVVLWPGENISAEWRVDAIEAGQVVFTYLPLGQKQSLPWTASP